MRFQFRDPVSAWTHLFGAGASLLGLFALLNFHPGGTAWTISLVVYGLSLCGMFLASAVYHTVVAGPRVIQTLRKIDHSAIYLLIAGTYTPFCVNAFTGFWNWGLLAVIWGLAALGVITKVLILHAPRWVTAGIYILMGWISVFATREMVEVLPRSTILWMLSGGIIYTLGAVVYITKRLDIRPGVFGFHEVWHIFVLLGAAAHFIAVTSLLAL